MRSRYRLFVLLFIFLPVVLPAQTPPPADLDTYVEAVRRQFEVPGLSVAIVKDGQCVLAKGYGVRRIGSTDRVDGQTLFGIASNTKAFTATAIALLVEEGRLRWDAPVVRYLPWFRLSDPYVTDHLSVRDLLVHRSGLGLGAGDLLWWPPSTYTRREIAERLRYLPLATSFRSTYAYDNVLYSVAGELIESVTGQSWEDFVSSRILAPAGMSASSVRHSDAERSGNVARPHAVVDGRVAEVKPFTSDLTNPAGGINSCAADMAKWLILQLDSGRTVDGSRLYTQGTARELWTIVTPVPIGDGAPELRAIRPNFNGYALGFNVRDYRGRKLVTHTGGLPGYVSRVMLVPGERLGVAVLTNQEEGAAFDAITYHLLDHYLKAPETDWISAYKRVNLRRDSVVAANDAATLAGRDSLSRPSLPLERYAGTYTDAWYGDIRIAFESGRLVMTFSKSPDLSGDLVHWQHDTFVVRWYDRELRADAFVTFALNPDGSIERARMKAVSPATDFSFDFQDLLLIPAP